MRHASYPFLLVMFLGLCVVDPSYAADGIVLPTLGAGCQTLRSNREESVVRCPGPAGAFMEYVDFVTHGGIAFGWGKRAAESDPDDLGWKPHGSGIASRMEWRVTNGRPFAAIIGRWQERDVDAPSLAYEELLVVKLSETEACKIAVLGALAPDAMSSARRIADEKAASFRCGFDKPIEASGNSNALVTLWDDRFNDRQTFNHNGSIVELTRTSDGSIEIRYTEPRKELRISAGTVLFRGAARNGKVTGEAFLFRPDCAPLGYSVAGERKDGVLVLEGKAPQRSAGSCEVTKGSPGKSSRLAFEHEPVLQPALSGPPQTQPDAIADCSRCIPGTIKSIDGIDTDHASLRAQITEDDVKRHCEGQEIDEDRIAECVKGNADEVGRVLRSTANCTALTIEPSAGGRFRFYKMGEDYGGQAPVWIDIDKHEIECGARACTGPAASAHFALLCPSAIPGWKGHWVAHQK